jgi:hypothetical protein
VLEKTSNGCIAIAAKRNSENAGVAITFISANKKPGQIGRAMGVALSGLVVTCVLSLVARRLCMGLGLVHSWAFHR